MEVASLQQPALNMDATMDMDMDIDLGPMPEVDAIEMDSVAAAPQESGVDPLDTEAQYEKIHVRGVDELTTDNIKQFAAQHFTVELPSRVEWIDDTSANIVYSSPDIGLQALAAFTQIIEEEAASLPALRLRSAKALSSHPDSVLQVRAAVKTDRKKARAHEASRFYLMHPEHDPRERLRRELADRRRQGGGGDTSDGEYRRRRFDDQELRRRRDRDGDYGITANMYDDTTTNNTNHSTDDLSDAERSRPSRRRRERDELFPGDDSGRLSGRLRNRSASPGRDTLDDIGRVERGDNANNDDNHNHATSSRRRFRERSPQLSRRNQGRELFPAKNRADSSEDDTRELFPNKTAASFLKKELFPTKNSNHRRSDAFDAADETADLFARRISVPLVDGAHDAGRNKNIELFPDTTAVSSRIRGSAAGRGGEGSDLSIRGAAAGLAIKGKGKGKGMGMDASVRELFPSKYNNANAGKELFSEKIDGRGGQRRRAEDMFS